MIGDIVDFVQNPPLNFEFVPPLPGTILSLYIYIYTLCAYDSTKPCQRTSQAMARLRLGLG